MRFAVLGSGATGNAALVEAGSNMVLVDAGLRLPVLQSRMEGLGLAFEHITAVLLTHEHHDHTLGLKSLSKAASAPVFCNAATRDALSESKIPDERFRIFESGQAVELDDGLCVQTLRISHDARDPVGFVFGHRDKNFAFLHDLGDLPDLEILTGSSLDAIYLEANYCPELLAADTTRLESIKDRIVSPQGHLSNNQAAELVSRIAGVRTKHIILGHLHETSNSPERAKDAVVAALHQSGTGQATVPVALADGPPEWVCF